MIRFPKPAKRSPQERKATRRRRARAARKAKSPGVKYLTALADVLHSIRMRATREGCELAPYRWYRAKDCQGPEVHPSRLQLAHGFTRQDKGTRYAADNTFVACANCHRKHTPSGAAWYAWMQERLGPQVYDSVQRRAQAWSKLPADYLLVVCRECLEEIGHLPHSIRREWAEERLAALAPKLRRAGLA